MRQKLSVLLFTATILCVSLCGTAVQAQIDIPGAEQIITKFRIQPKSEVLFATINGKEKRIASAAGHAWIIEGGRKLVYTKSEGQTGPSGLGGTLNVYDPQTNQYKKLAQH